MILGKNFFHLPGRLGRLRHYAKHTDEYTFEEKYAHI
jgi:hypothetical protein